MIKIKIYLMMNMMNMKDKVWILIIIMIENLEIKIKIGVVNRINLQYKELKNQLKNIYNKSKKLNLLIKASLINMRFSVKFIKSCY